MFVKLDYRKVMISIYCEPETSSTL